ncbi:hypothetical protein [Polynucleobacter sp. MWH-Berg-3C6]|uniref:hypothetical protein n=1 Tax=Polynucleobacter sp. MWH-Berg-3C6 TaxID=1855882 RepID=UPI001C0B6439|nr:hypothetical protein [Polynucleobacter sp. MWH-Berg-3C6]MBU3551389.1 hypothetical protein [Polynucleobacter sp. MWH-Berg-3C6]
MNSLMSYLLTFALSISGGLYLGHNYTKNHYEAQIASDKASRQEAITQAVITEQAKTQKATAGFITSLRIEQGKSAIYQGQAKALYVNGTFGINPSNCAITFGFIRLFNASATGEASLPISTDALCSPIDIAAVLSTSIENHRKYHEVAAQIEAIKASND